MAANGNEHSNSTALIRTIGRWSLTALVINSIIGSGIFGLPSVVSGRVGKMAPLAYFVAGAGMAVIAGCLAEVASQFRETGGPYLYARETLGRFWGIQIAWMTWLSRIAAGSGTANLFTTYLGHVFPRATEPIYRFAILSSLVGVLAVVNYIGVKSGARASDFFTALKLVLLATFIGAGLWWMAVHSAVTPTPLAHAVGPRDWLEATLVLVYAYGGFEAVLLASGEMRDPRHDAPIALMIGIASVALIYTLVQVVVSGTLHNPAATQRPLADSAAAVLGSGAAAAIAIGALFSIYGYLSANMLHTPRLTFALAERGDIPVIFARIHPRFRTPYVSIALYTVFLLAFTLAGNFRWNITLSAIVRLFTYGSIAIALLVLRKRNPGADAFRLPGGPVLAVVAILFCIVLLLHAPLSNSTVVAATAAAAALNWALVRKRSTVA
ncbi:MAG TPA: APC family permease [Candidatus Acidoferrum sp.]|nr:APC family permease [Candidatus Acidoferrum sp.]